MYYTHTHTFLFWLCLKAIHESELKYNKKATVKGFTSRCVKKEDLKIENVYCMFQQKSAHKMPVIEETPINIWTQPSSDLSLFHERLRGRVH